MDFWKRCDHEWEVIDEEEGTYRLSTCMICGAYRSQDFVNGTDEIAEPHADEEYDPQDPGGDGWTAEDDRIAQETSDEKSGGDDAQ